MSWLSFYNPIKSVFVYFYLFIGCVGNVSAAKSHQFSIQVDI